MDSVKYVVKSVGPKLVPFFKTVAIYFVIFPSRENPTLFATLLKCLPIISLMLFVLLHGMSLEEKFKYSRRILTGLVFCCMGDALLVWPGYFEAGMIAFAIGHLYYIFAFGFEHLNLTIGIAVLALDISGIMFVLPGVKGTVLTVAVPIYTFILGVMLWRALAQLSSTKDLRNWNKVCSCVGGILFAVSDSILGINMFKTEIAYSRVLIMFSYYAAQLGIALSVVDSSQRSTLK